MGEMTDAQTAAHLRRYVEKSHGLFSWPTDACGYRQHMRFVNARNTCWGEDTPGTFEEFILRYAALLEVGAVGAFEIREDRHG